MTNKVTSSAKVAPASYLSTAKISNEMQNVKTSFNVSTITPQIARELIADTIGFTQRVSHKATIQSYAEAMKRGEWKLSYEPIILGTHGNVLNGMHRLKACVEANTSFEALVVGGASDHIFDTLDNGRIRTLGDRLSSKNYSNYNTVASTIAFLYTIDKGQYGLSTGKGGRVAVSGSNAKYKVTPTQALEFLKNNPNYENFVAEGLKIFRIGSRLIVASQFIALWYICSKHDSQRANQFFYKLSTGSNLEEDSPIFYTRKRLIDHNNKTDTLKGNQSTNMILKAFDMFCSNKRIEKHFVIPKENFALKTQFSMF